MNLNEKSKIELAAACLKRSEFFTAVIGRTYYAVFLMVKHYLAGEYFDYKKFLKENKYEEREREYSHGTLRQALSGYLFDKGYKYQELILLTKIDQLYNIRRKADYRPEKIWKTVLMTPLK